MGSIPSRMWRSEQYVSTWAGMYRYGGTLRIAVIITWFYPVNLNIAGASYKVYWIRHCIVESILWNTPSAFCIALSKMHLIHPCRHRSRTAEMVLVKSTNGSCSMEASNVMDRRSSLASQCRRHQLISGNKVRNMRALSVYKHL